MHILNRYTLSTPENVELEFTLAGIGNRAFALLIDYPLWFITWAGFLVLWSFVSSEVVNLVVRVTGNADTVELWLAAIALLVLFVLYVGYFILFETLWQGQTPGKRLAKIRVIRADGRPVGLTQATLRALLRPLDDFPFLGIVGGLLIFFSKREQRLGDLLAGTLVIIEEQPATPTAIVLSPEADALAIELPAIANLEQLLPDDFAVLRDYLQWRSGMAPGARTALCLELAHQAAAIVNLGAEDKAKMQAETLLEALYLAYQRER
ncbi:MAG: RDD family protein [Synechococcales bacterium]|nr:RDD family protein [Synechococcales bacterium]